MDNSRHSQSEDEEMLATRKAGWAATRGIYDVSWRDHVHRPARVDQTRKERKGVVTAPVEAPRAKRLVERISFRSAEYTEREKRARVMRCEFVSELEKLRNSIVLVKGCNPNLNKIFDKRIFRTFNEWKILSLF